MAGSSPELDGILQRLGSLDGDERLEALEQVKRYAGNRRVDQAVFEMRNDADRRVRAAARALLAESERKSSSGLAVQGAVQQEASEHLDELLKLAQSQVNTDRMTALKELRKIDHPKAVAAVEAMKRDPDRTVRMVAGAAVEDRVTRNSVSTGGHRIENGLLVNTSPVAMGSAPVKPMNVELISTIGLVYLAVGIPASLLCLWIWLGVQGILPHPCARGAMAAGCLRPGQFDASPPPGLMQGAVHAGLGDPLLLAVLIAVGLWVAVAGAGLAGRKPWGRHTALSAHAVLALSSLAMPDIPTKLGFGILNLFLCWLYTRPALVLALEPPKPADPDAPVQRDQVSHERKVW